MPSTSETFGEHFGVNWGSRVEHIFLDSASALHHSLLCGDFRYEDETRAFLLYRFN